LRIPARPADAAGGSVKAIAATFRALAAVAAILVAIAILPQDAAGFTVGSKAFPESWILGEALARSARAAGVSVVYHRSNLGGTEIVYEALRGGAIDLYPEYTGTV